MTDKKSSKSRNKKAQAEQPDAAPTMPTPEPLGGPVPSTSRPASAGGTGGKKGGGAKAGAKSGAKARTGQPASADAGGDESPYSASPAAANAPGAAMTNRGTPTPLALDAEAPEHTGGSEDRGGGQGMGGGQAGDDAMATADSAEGGAYVPSLADTDVHEAPAVVERGRERRVGLFVGREWSFPPAFIEEVAARDAGVTIEFAKIGAPRFDEPCPYDLCIDRISHEVPVYRTYLKQAVLNGTRVVNNPFMWTADDKFFGATLADKLGVASPKTVVLPNKQYVPGIVPSESLRNMEYPLDWQGVVDYVGLPCILKDAHGGGWKEVYVCRSLEELLHNYDRSGLLTMIVQEFIEWDQFVRCLVIGQQDVLPMKYDPKERRYLVEHEHLSPELGGRIVKDSLTLVRALGYDMNSIEFAVRGGVPYAIDFMNPAPDMDIYSLTPDYFEWTVQRMADMAIRLAGGERQTQARELNWAGMFKAGR